MPLYLTGASSTSLPILLLRALMALGTLALGAALFLVGGVLLAGLAGLGVLVGGGVYLWLRFGPRKLAAKRRQRQVIDGEFTVVQQHR